MTTSLYDSNQLLLKCEAAHTALLMEKRFQAHLEKLLQRISLSTLQAFKVGAVEVSQKGQFTLIPYFVGGMCKDLRAFDGGIPLSSSKVKDPPLYNGDAIVPGEPITIVSSPLRVLELHSQNVPAVAPFLRTFTAKNAKELHKASEIGERSSAPPRSESLSGRRKTIPSSLVPAGLWSSRLGTHRRYSDGKPEAARGSIAPIRLKEDLRFSVRTSNDHPRRNRAGDQDSKRQDSSAYHSLGGERLFLL